MPSRQSKDNFSNVFLELNNDDLTLICPLLEEFSLNLILSGDMIEYVRGCKQRSTIRSVVDSPAQIDDSTYI